MVSHLIYNLKSNESATRITYIEFNENVNILIPLNEPYFQDNVLNIMREIRFGTINCGTNSNGDTDLYSAIQVSVNELSVFGERENIKKMVIISNCMDDTNKICADSKALLDRIGIDVYLINIPVGRAPNKLNIDQVKVFGECLDPKAICYGDNDEIVTEKEVIKIADDCLLPMICHGNDNTVSNKVNAGNCDILSDSFYDNLYGNDYKIEYIILFDNSCKIINNKCNEIIFGISDIIQILLGNTNKISVATLQFTDSANINVLVDFNDSELQNNATKYVQYIQQNTKCTENENGNTNLKYALHKALEQYTNNIDMHINYIRKLIIISACYDDNEAAICHHSVSLLKQLNVDSFIVNIINISNSINTITNYEADKYLKCIATNNFMNYSKRLCNGTEFKTIMDKCLQPTLCAPSFEIEIEISDISQITTTMTPRAYHDDAQINEKMMNNPYYKYRTSNEMQTNNTNQNLSNLNQQITNHKLLEKFEQYKLNPFNHWIMIATIMLVVITMLIGMCILLYILLQNYRKLEHE